MNSGFKTLETVFERLEQANLCLKFSTCKLFKKLVTILGILVSANEFRQDPSRAEVINSLQFPKTLKQLRGIIRMCSFSRNFHKGFAKIAYPLTACLRKGALLVRNEETERAFEKLKECMANNPVFSMYDPNSVKFIVECDSSCHS